MSADWTVFDWPFAIVRIAHTPAVRDQTTSAYTPASTTESPIKGNFDREIGLGAQDAFIHVHDSTGEIFTGAMRIYTNATLKVTDAVRVHLDNTGNNYLTYRVNGINQTFGFVEQFLGPSGRHEYRLNLMEPDL